MSHDDGQFPFQFDEIASSIIPPLQAVVSTDCFTLDASAKFSAEGSRHSIDVWNQYNDDGDGLVHRHSGAPPSLPSSKSVRFAPWVECRKCARVAHHDGILPLEMPTTRFWSTDDCSYGDVATAEQAFHPRGQHLQTSWVDFLNCMDLDYPWSAQWKNDNDDQLPLPVQDAFQEDVDDESQVEHDPVVDEYVAIQDWNMHQPNDVVRSHQSSHQALQPTCLAFLNWVDASVPWITTWKGTADDEIDQHVPALPQEGPDEESNIESDHSIDDYVSIDSWRVHQPIITGLQPSEEDPVTVISFGIRGEALGRRDGRIHSADPHHLAQTLWDMWQDAIPQFDMCQAFFVTPQPLHELQATRAVVFIVEIKPYDFALERRVTLRITTAEWGPVLQQPEAVYVPSRCHVDWLRTQHSWIRWCAPHGFRHCTVEFGGRIIDDEQPFPTFNGALLKFWISDVPAQFMNVCSWFPHAERVAQVAMHYHVRGVLFFRLVFRMFHRPDVVRDVIYQDLLTPARLLALLPVDCQGHAFLIHTEPQESVYQVGHRPQFCFQEYLDAHDAVDSDSDDSSLMQRPLAPHGDLSPHRGTHDPVHQVVLQLGKKPTHVDAPSGHPFDRRTEFIHGFCTHRPGVWRWASVFYPFQHLANSVVDLLIELPRAADTVDIILNFYDFPAQEMTAFPVVMRVSSSVSIQDLLQQIHQEFRITPLDRDDAVFINGQAMPPPHGPPLQFVDGDIVQVAFRPDADLDVCDNIYEDEAIDTPNSDERSIGDDELIITTILFPHSQECDRIDVVTWASVAFHEAAQYGVDEAQAAVAIPCADYALHPQITTLQRIAVGSWRVLRADEAVVLLREDPGAHDANQWAVQIFPVNVDGGLVSAALWRPAPSHYMLGPSSLRIIASNQHLVLQSGTVITCLDNPFAQRPVEAFSLLQTHRSVRRVSTVGLSDYTEDNMDLCSDPTARLRAPLMTDRPNLLTWFDQQDFCVDCATDRDMVSKDDSYISRHFHFAGGPDYTEDNTDLCSGRHNLPGDMSFQASLPSSSNAVGSDLSCPLTCLHQAMKQLCTKNWTGLNTDFSQLCIQHPAARCALEVQQGYSFAQPSLRIYTDGSCKGTDAAWAFVVVAQIPTRQGPSFWKIGFAADALDDTVGPFLPTAMDAEATALIAAVEFLLPVVKLEQTVHFHFDASAVGFGAYGVQAIPTHHGQVSTRQHNARVMMSFLQQQTRTYPVHVHAHEGNPFNELVDSIASKVRKGWRPAITPHLCSGLVLAHPCRDWAWLFFVSSDVVPALPDLLTNPPCSPRRYAGDTRLDNPPQNETEAAFHGQLNVATANVATMEYGCDGVSFSHKCRYLMSAFQQAAFDVVAIQESRARHSETRVDGSYIRLISAAQQGHGGVELWFSKHGFWSSHDIVLSPEDFVVWHNDARMIFADLHWGTCVLTFCVAYAPQSGQADDAIQQWWAHLSKLFERIPNDRPVFFMGDLNSHVGSVESAAVGSLAPDIENVAGTMLRQLCDKHQLLLPSTFPQWHEGCSHTFIHPKGSRHRLDYIAIRQFQQNAVQRSWVATDIELANGQCDHLLVALQMDVLMNAMQHTGFKRQAVYNRTKAQMDFQQHDDALLQVPTIPWSVDVNDHWHLARQALQVQAKQAFPFEKRVRRQQYFDQAAWDAMCHRKALRQEHRAAQREMDCCTLRTFFSVWKLKHIPDEVVHEGQFQLHVLRMQDALFVHQRQQCDDRFRRNKRQAWKQWALDNAQKIRQDLQHGDVFRILKPKRA